MSYVILGLAAVAAWHFFYEFIFAPLFRLETRAEAFELKQRLAEVKAEHGEEFSDRHYQLFRDALVALEHLVVWFDVSVLMRFREDLAADKGLRTNIENRVREMGECKLQVVQDIDREADMLALRVLRINNAGWLVYFLPVLLMRRLMGQIQRGIKKLLAAPQPELTRLTPAPCRV